VTILGAGSWARAGAGIRPGPEVVTDVVIVGAGPTALFAVFQLGLAGLSCHLVDILDRPGGQCTELYPEKPIYDIPGYPAISAQELVGQLARQCAPFKPDFHLGEMVAAIDRLDEGDFRVRTDAGTSLRTKIVVIAAGGGSFQPKRPPIPGIEHFEGKSVFYSVRRIADFTGRRIVVVGGGDSALDWAINLHPHAKSIALVHRRDEFRAAPASVARMRELEADGLLRFIQGSVVRLTGGEGALSEVTIAGPAGEIALGADRLLPFFGLTMKLGPIADWGLDLRGGLIAVDTEKFETSIPGMFAIGDINWYPGKLKLILSGFHEAALMAQAARRIVHPDRKVVFQYTTSSTSVRRMLGVAS
jgi:thioredoxin reductase (NADPH)